MKTLKLSVFFAFCGLFIFACTNTGNTNVAVNNTKISVNQNGTTATYEQTQANTPAASGDELAHAKEIYTTSCVGCHKENGGGGEGLYQGNKVKVPSYKSPRVINAPDEKLADKISNGEEDEMPAFKDKLKPEEIQSLVKFIRKEFQGK